MMIRKGLVLIVLFVGAVLVACGCDCRSRKHVVEEKKEDSCAVDIEKKAKQVAKQSRKAIVVDELLKCECDTDSTQFLVRDGYIALYSLTTHCPVYVSWKLTPERVDGDEPRCKSFFPDMEIDEADRVVKSDYSGSGWSRGHMCPAADNKDSRTRMEESCLMTNICPQDMGLNNGRWNDLENKCRNWARKGDTVYIVCGPLYYTPQYRWIGNNISIAIPDAFYKVIYRITPAQKQSMFAYIFPNTDVTDKLDQFQTTVDHVETLTHIDFFHALPDDKEEALESK